MIGPTLLTALQGPAPSALQGPHEAQSRLGCSAKPVTRSVNRISADSSRKSRRKNCWANRRRLQGRGGTCGGVCRAVSRSQSCAKFASHSHRGRMVVLAEAGKTLKSQRGCALRRCALYRTSRPWPYLTSSRKAMSCPSQGHTASEDYHRCCDHARVVRASDPPVVCRPLAHAQLMDGRSDVRTGSRSTASASCGRCYISV